MISRAPIIYGLFDPRDGTLRYVGKSLKGAADRLASHLCPSSLRDRTKKNGWLKSLLKKSLRPEWEVLDRPQLNGLNEAEQFWIAYYKSIGCELLNMTPGGDGHHGRIYSPELREKIGAAQRGKPKPKHSAETRAKMSAAHKGRKATAETRAKMSAAQRGIKHTPESIEAMREVHRANWSKPGYAEKMSRAHGCRPFWDHLGRRYETVNGAARQLGLTSGEISAALNGKRKSARGFTFSREA